jgi:3-oxoacyl-[acyl-carrier protein] reductase
MSTQTCLVTGASRGIGAAIADHLGAAGHTVIGTATSAAGAAGIDERFRDLGVRGRGLVLDVADGHSVDELFVSIKSEFDAPLVLINNAGITADNLLLRMKDDEWQRVIDTNLGSVYRLSKACLRAMTKARWGRIVNISSVVATMGNAGQSNYAASKAGVEAFTRSLAREVGSRGITVNAVAPGFIETDMTGELPAAQREAMMAQIAVGRFGSAVEIAAVVAFLISENAAYITGETIQVNGGMYMA